MRTRTEISDETIRQSDAAPLYVKLRKMIASDRQPTDTILGAIAVAAHSLTGATGAAIAMPRDGSVVCVGRSGETAPKIGGRLDVDSGISGECLRTGVILRCDDASRDFHVDAEVCRQWGLQSIAAVPLRGQEGRVGVLEAFSTEAYAFTEDSMEILGRLAGLAEAAWARGEVPQLPVADTDLAAGESATAVDAAVEAAIETPVEIPKTQSEPLVDEVPLATVREALAGTQQKESRAWRKWLYPLLIGVALLGLTLLTVYGGRTWSGASVASRSRQAASPQIPPPENKNTVPEAAFALAPAAAATPSAEPPARHPTGAASGEEIPDVVVRRQPRARAVAHAVAPETEPSSDAVSNSENVPQIAASTAAPTDLGKVVSASAVLPKLGVPVSQGVAGGVLVHKVQPIYPPEARRMRVEGNVVIDATVTVKGEIDDLKLVSGDVLLSRAAIDAVRQWRYTPFLLNGQPIPKQTRITISFIAP
ncbi:MAG: TonB family protein [Terriglobales bacterium]